MIRWQPKAALLERTKPVSSRPTASSHLYTLPPAQRRCSCPQNSCLVVWAAERLQHTQHSFAVLMLGKELFWFKLLAIWPSLGAPSRCACQDRDAASRLRRPWTRSYGLSDHDPCLTEWFFMFTCCPEAEEKTSCSREKSQNSDPFYQ